MIDKIKSLLSPTKETFITVVFTEAVFVAGQAYQAGDSAMLTEKQAAEVIASGAGYDPDAKGTSEAELARLNALVPAPVEPRALPESWASLPTCFTDWWTMNEQARTLIVRRDRIEAELIGRVKNGVADIEHDLRGVPAGQRDQVLASAIGALVRIGPPDVAKLREVRHLEDAFQRAATAVEAWREANAAKLFVHKLACSDHLQSVHGETCRAIRELHELGREIFGQRVAALGLSEARVDDLFRGSADAVKYSNLPRPTLDDMVVGWSKGNGETRLYCDKSPEAMVDLVGEWKHLAGEVARLTKQARSELAKATKAAA